MMFHWIFQNISNHKQAECLKKSNQKSGYDFKQIIRKPEIVLFCTLDVLSVLHVTNLLCANCPLNYFVFNLHGGIENNFSSSVAFSNDQYNCAIAFQPQHFVSFRKKFLTWKKTPTPLIFECSDFQAFRKNEASKIYRHPGRNQGRNHIFLKKWTDNIPAL